MSEWKKYKLDDLINVKHGYAFKGEFFSDEPTDDILLTPGNFKIGGGFKSDKFKYFAGEYPESYILKEGDILITMTDLSKEGDTLGYAAKIPAHSGIRYLHNQRLGLVEFKNKEVDKDFLYWILRTQQYQYFIVGSATGSTVRHTSPSRIVEYEFLAPESKAEQQKIASILSSLDDKIELNNQMNQTLEQIAQAIFKEWFVEFNFPGFDGNLVDGVPKGWRKGKLGELVKVQNGFAFKSSDLKNNGVNGIIKIKNISNNKVDIINTQYVSDEVFQKTNSRFLVKGGDVLIAMTGAEVGKIGLVPAHNKNLLLNQRVGNFIENKDYAKWFVYFLLIQDKFQNILYQTASGSAQPNISSSQIENIEIIIPTEKLIKNYGVMVNSFVQRTIGNHFQNEVLKGKMQILLPKLLKH